MTFPAPVPGLVIRYSCLWHDEYEKGMEEGVKDRPCAIILATQTAEGEDMVMVLPVTHVPPTDPALALEIPAATKARLGLDDERSWIVLTKLNRFIWPGPDIRPAVRGEAASVAYGLLPARFYLRLKACFLDIYRARRTNAVTRTK